MLNIIGSYTIKKQTIDAFYCLILAIVIVKIQFLVFNRIEDYSDNYFYKKAFEGIHEKGNITGGYLFFVWRTSGSEPLSFLIFYIFSYFLDYKSFIFLMNVCFYMLIAMFYRRQKINFLLVFGFLITNYYLLIMSIGVHRIKLSFIFLFLALILKDRGRKVFLVLAPLVHFQIFIVHISAIMGVFITRLSQGKLNKISMILLPVIGGAVLVLGTFSKIFSKFFSKIDFHGDGIVSLVLLIIFVIAFRVKNLPIIIYLLFISGFAFLIGGYRMNMVLFMSFIIISGFISKKESIMFNLVASIYLVLKIYNLYHGHYQENLIIDS